MTIEQGAVESSTALSTFFPHRRGHTEMMYATLYAMEPFGEIPTRICQRANLTYRKLKLLLEEAEYRGYCERTLVSRHLPTEPSSDKPQHIWRLTSTGWKFMADLNRVLTEEQKVNAVVLQSRAEMHG